MPHNPESESDIGAGEAKDLKPLKDVPGFRWELPMGQPIVRIPIAPIADSEDNEKCEAIKPIIEPFLRIDQQNSVLHRLGLGYFECPLNIRTDQPIQKFGIGIASEHPNSTKSKVSAANLTKIVAGTLHSYRSIGRADLIAPWIPVLQQLPILASNQLVQAVIADAVRFAEENAEERGMSRG
jgi:hypothetical protein